MSNISLKLTPESQATIKYWTQELTADFRAMVIEPWVNELGRKWKDELEGSFTSESQPRGPVWKALSPKYAAWKQRHGYPDLIGTLTGALSRSIFKELNVARATVAVGSQGVEYAQYFNAVRSIFPPFTLAEDDAYGVFNSKVRRFTRKVNGNE